MPALERAWQDGALTWASCGALLPLEPGRAVSRVSDNFIRRAAQLRQLLLSTLVGAVCCKQACGLHGRPSASSAACSPPLHSTEHS